tara:strand:- start:279 stop:800 length:522 start_codon:yes stop_codon:yes gene_type:complete
MEKLNKYIKQIYLPVLIILVLSFSRLIPHPWNFTPIIAAGVFSGFYFKNFILSSFIVVCSMFIGDIFIGFHDTMFFTYISLFAAAGFGILIKNFKVLEILFAGLASSASFFIITNFGSWLTLDMYEKNFSGLINSYILGIPFFHNTVLSTLIYLAILKIIFDFSIKKTIKLTS